MFGGFVISLDCFPICQYGSCRLISVVFFKLFLLNVVDVFYSITIIIFVVVGQWARETPQQKFNIRISKQHLQWNNTKKITTTTFDSSYTVDNGSTIHVVCWCIRIWTNRKYIKSYSECLLGYFDSFTDPEKFTQVLHEPFFWMFNCSANI